PFGFGEPVTEEDVEPWDIDVGPDGEGLPAGSGTVAEGAVVYEASCARCHGPDAVDGAYGPLVATEGAGSFPFGRDPSLTTSVGNFWPYATTVFDYVRRSMPFDDLGSLSDEDVYAVTAWLLWRNGLIDEDAVMSAETLPAVEMPAREHFVPSEDVSLTSLP
ncbi:MAG: c-type cytochrome, partial [Gemmatimonadota bacterium]